MHACMCARMHVSMYARTHGHAHTCSSIPRCASQLVAPLLTDVLDLLFNSLSNKLLLVHRHLGLVQSTFQQIIVQQQHFPTTTTITLSNRSLFSHAYLAVLGGLSLQALSVQHLSVILKGTMAASRNTQWARNQCGQRICNSHKRLRHAEAPREHTLSIARNQWAKNLGRFGQAAETRKRVC